MGGARPIALVMIPAKDTETAMNRREALYAMAMAGLASSIPGGSAAGRQAARTYVLVHGAWHGGWCWSRVAERLRAAGSRVFTPTCTGLGDRAHLLSPDVGLATFIEDVVSTIETEELNDVILVGHSFGGTVISGAADALMDRVRHLVYLDAFLPKSGRSPFSLFSPDVVEARRKSAIEAPGLGGKTLAMPPPPPDVFGVTDPDDVAWLARHLRPHPIKTYEDALMLKHAALGAGRPKTFIACTVPQYPTLDPTHEWVRSQPDWTYKELATGHDAMVTAPAALSEMLLGV